MKKKKWKNHVDNDWIMSKIDGRGGGYSFKDCDGLAVIDFICRKSFLQVTWYNLVLLFKYLKRRYGGKYAI